jgi:hypothetical protein
MHNLGEAAGSTAAGPVSPAGLGAPVSPAGTAGPVSPAGPVGQERLQYLHEVGRLLWPSPAVFGAGRGAPVGPGLAPVSEFLLLPRPSQPRLLVPASRRVAAAAVRGYGEPGSRVAAAGARLLPLLLTAGLAPVAMRTRFRVSAPPGTATIETCLREAAGPGITFSLHLGAPRANRKPVLQLLTGDGATAGFAKIGINPLTSELVTAEHAALSQLSQARLAQLQLPGVLAFTQWAGLEVLVLSPLPVWHRRVPLAAGALGAAMAELAQVSGLHRGPLAGSSYLRRLRARLAATGDGPDRAALAALLDGLVQRAGSTELSFGSWHGDWTPWNMASTSAGLLVWDWERFTGDVPVGFDALHCQLQAEVVAGQQDVPDATAACARSVAGAPQLLTPFGAGPAAARLTAVLYLTDIATRYLADRQEQAGQRLGAPGRWLIPAIGAATAQL